MTENPNAIDDGRGALRAYSAAIVPPANLEARVRSSLAGRGLIRGTPPRRSAWAFPVGLVAAGMILGALLSHGMTRTGGRPATQPGQYVLLLLGETQGDTGAVHVAREREYGRWAASLANGARWVGGHELADVVDDIGPKSRSEPAVDRLAGYFVIDAPSREIAAEVARTCPHVKYGGRVVVMAIAS